MSIYALEYWLLDYMQGKASDNYTSDDFLAYKDNEYVHFKYLADEKEKGHIIVTDTTLEYFIKDYAGSYIEAQLDDLMMTIERRLKAGGDYKLTLENGKQLAFDPISDAVFN